MTSPSKAFLLCALALFLNSCGGNGDGTSARLARETRAGEKNAQATFDAALAAEKAGKMRRARTNYNAVVLKYPLSAIAHEAAFRNGKLLEKAGDPLEAFDSYNNVLTKYPASKHYLEAMNRQETIANNAANGHITSSFIGLIKTRISVKETTKMLAQVRDNAPRALSAERAQFSIGRIHQKNGDNTSNSAKAIAAFRKLTRDFPDSKYAPQAQYQIGKILLAEAKGGNQDSANLDRAKQAFDDVLIRYPDSKEAKLAKLEVSKLGTSEVQRTFDVAEFYRKKGIISSALFYYQETVNRSRQGPLYTKSQEWIKKLSAP